MLAVVPLLCAVPAAVSDVAVAQATQPGASPAGSDLTSLVERRCVVCHACYDAPCQLLLTSQEGVERGGIGIPVYHGTRLKTAEPTRLGFDARSVAAWRNRGFHSVLDPGVSAVGESGWPRGLGWLRYIAKPLTSPKEAAPQSDAAPVLLRMLELGAANPRQPGKPLPDDFPLAIDRSLDCPTARNFDAYAQARPGGGMPYGTAPLAAAEYERLRRWAVAGGQPQLAPTRGEPSLGSEWAARLADQVERWEAILNGPTAKERVVARYLYEHWFLAHLYFVDLPAGPYFEIVRSRTPPGQPISAIGTRRPYDDPGVERFWYRLRRIESTIVHKTHIVYGLGEKRMERLRELFWEADWSPTRLPSYELDEASNPFISFDQIPARSRYQFLLDDARYFVMSFIRGPVCRGRAAVDVIEDHFFIAFVDPDHDVAVVDPGFLPGVKELLHLPARWSDGLVGEELWRSHNLGQARYLDERIEAYERLRPDGRGADFDALWDGGGSDPDSLLTVFRHLDNASVLRGFVGDVPETVWVMDFPIFERIYYDLVAGFDVFGDAPHQLATRLYMDHLRMQSETNFLAFLPADRRESIRAQWYRGAEHEVDYFLIERIRSEEFETEIRYRSDDPVREFVQQLLDRRSGALDSQDTLNRCGAPPCRRASASDAEARIEAALQPLASRRGPFVQAFPELSLLRVHEGDAHWTYTVINNRAHTNVAFIFAEGLRLEPELDTLTIVPGIAGSYPNFVWNVALDEIEAFARAGAAAGGEAGREALVERFGVRRTSAEFWRVLDLVHEEFRATRPLESGILDVNRYHNR